MRGQHSPGTFAKGGLGVLPNEKWQKNSPIFLEVGQFGKSVTSTGLNTRFSGISREGCEGVRICLTIS